MADNVSSESINSQALPELLPRPARNNNYLHAHVLTWNVAGNMPAESDIKSLFLPQASALMSDLVNDTDLLVVGLQEAYQNVQHALSSSLPVVGRDPLVEAFSSVLSKVGFARVSFYRLLGLVIIVFVKRPLLCYLRDIETASLKTGFGGLLGNKGAVCVRMCIGNLSVCFTNCHLVPHIENNYRRVEELSDIMKLVIFDPSSMHILDHDITILFGDLNFRIDNKGYHEIIEHLSSNKDELFKHDQLRLEQVKGVKSTSLLHVFMEMPLEFPPSYKYKPDTDNYEDEEKGRPPAWCDRVLWNIHERKLPKITDMEPQSLVKPDYYKMLLQPRISDHKPVCAGLKLLADLSMELPHVIFRLAEWVSGESFEVALDVMAGTSISVWDWVGLYPENFACVDRDSVYWIYTPANRGVSTETVCYSRVLSSELSLSPGRYLWLYWSSQFKCVLGMSPLFRIVSR